MIESDSTEVVIKTTGLTKYYNKSIGIKDIELSVMQGEIYGFIGPNGAGKSTTIRLLLGLLFPTAGSGSVLGMDIIKESDKIKQKIGFIPSEVNYYPQLTPRQLLEYSARFYKTSRIDKIRQLADYFKLDLNKKIIDLSLGNKKKVSIIQCFLHNPDLYILDEATNGLDPLMQNRFFELLLDENKKGKTIFFSSHTLSEVQKLCTRVAIIKDGMIINVEEMKNLMDKNLKRITIVPEEYGKINSQSIPGIISFTIEDGIVQFLYKGNINELIHLLSLFKVKNLSIEEPLLEEIFMHYYDEDRKSL